MLSNDAVLTLPCYQTAFCFSRSVSFQNLEAALANPGVAIDQVFFYLFFEYLNPGVMINQVLLYFIFQAGRGDRPGAHPCAAFPVFGVVKPHTILIVDLALRGGRPGPDQNSHCAPVRDPQRQIYQPGNVGEEVGRAGKCVPSTTLSISIIIIFMPYAQGCDLS